MIDGYNLFLNSLKDKYPDIYVKIHHLPESSIKGIVNAFQSSRISMKDELRVRTFFRNLPVMQEYTEIELRKK